MAALSTELRKQLEKTVIAARRTAEVGAKAALDALAIPHADPFPHMTPKDRDLRNRLRAHARQLGDRRHPSGTQAIDRLVHECAYEHWHRMLFARFLAENDLLVEPERGVAISLEECEDLARDRGIESWDLAGQFAQHMLPQIFRPDDPALRLSLPREHRGKLQGLLKELPAVVFRADDSLGWVYQFWQAEKKDQVNRSETKIGADELPAVTQLFTEDYMVLFLLHNTLGAWWAGKVLAERPELASKAKSEDELRKACAVGDVTWPYLRFVREDDGPWRPAAGAFDGWPKAAKEITVLDPCMGSGHFLVFALPILVAFRMAEEGLSREAAVDAVLRDNLFGLEIDARCTQIAAFYLALAAWRVVGHRPLPRLNLACSGLSLGVSKAEWLRLAEKAVTAADPAAKRDLLGVEKNLLTVGLEERVKNGLEALYDIFAKAPLLGSLIDPRRVGGDIFRANFAQLEPLLGSILAAAESDEMAEMAVAAQGMAKAAEMLGKSFCLVATNVPYLLRRKQHPQLLSFLKDHHPDTVNDLGIAFADRVQRFLCDHGCTSLVLPQNFIEIRSYQNLRRRLLADETWRLVVRIGPGAFQTISGEVVNVCLTLIERTQAAANHAIWSVNVTEENRATEKAVGLKSNRLSGVLQVAVEEGPEARFTLLTFGKTSRLGEVASASWGVSPADLPRFGRFFWEFGTIRKPWTCWQSSFVKTTPYTGRQLVLNMGPELDAAVDAGKALLRGKEYWGRSSIVATVMGDIPCTIGTGEPVDTNVATIVPEDEELLPALWAYCASGEFSENVRKFYSGLKVTSGTLPHVPFDVEHWKWIAAEQYPKGLPEPYSDDTTQWLFSGVPTSSTDPLHVATARLLGYSWPRQTGTSFGNCPTIGPDGLEWHANLDGIVCIPAVRGEEPAGDRLGALLATALGAEWSPAKERQLIAATGSKTDSLDDWLRTDFFAQHCALFHQRPFVWHVWDGRKDGFHALVNYHKLAEGGGKGRRLLETLTYSYLGDWIGRQKAAVGQGVAGADDRLAASIELQKELEKIIEGEPPYDIFVRWKPMHEQPIGWEPDINDGVRLNIRPFMSATLSRGRTGAGVLRAKPNIKWQKDRGKEPGRDRDDYSWFWNVEKFTGERHNDRHFTNAEKRAARQRRGDG